MIKYIQLNTTIVGATWHESKSKWVVKLEKRTMLDDDTTLLKWTEECDLLLNRLGFLNAWKWPEIPGIHSFKGHLFHTAHYKEGFDLKGKRIAVIGSGSSGVQVVASIYSDVEKLYTWIPSPTWITAAFGQQFAGKMGGILSIHKNRKKNLLGTLRNITATRR